MASIQQLAEDLFTCTLCLEKLRDPRTLPCLHSFCRTCLSSYITKTVRDWVFWCPVCEHEIHGKHQGVSVNSIDQWLESFVSNTFLGRISCVKSARAKEKACDICRQERVLVDAAYWCSECVEMLCEDCHRVHRRSKISRQHKMITVDDLQNETLEKLIRSPGSALKCPEHKENVMTLVCVDCKQAVCQMCVATAHTKCRRMEQLDKLGPSLRSDMQEAKRRVDSCRQRATKSAEDITRHLTRLTDSRDEASKELTTIKEKLVDLINKREERASAQVESAYARQRDLLTHQKRTCDVRHLSLGRTGQFLVNMLMYGTDVDILNNFDSIVKHVTVIENEPSPNLSRANPTIIKFSADKKSTEFLKNTHGSLGGVKISKGSNQTSSKADPTKENKLAVTALNLKPAQQMEHNKTTNGNGVAKPAKTVAFRKTDQDIAGRPKLVASFSGRCNNDTMKTDIKGILALGDGCVVVMDVQFRNKRLKKFNQRGKFISQLDPGDCPSSMTLVPDSDIVVNLPKAKEFVFVSASGTLHISGRIKAPKTYYAIASSPDGVIAAVTSSASEPLAIDLISFTGELLHSVQLDRIRFPLPPKDLVLTPCGLIYLVFSGKEVLVSMTYQGEIAFTYSAVSQHGVRRPISVECDALDNAYIADVESNAIHMVNSEGVYQGVAIGRKDGMREPLALCRMDGGVLAVTQSNGDVKLFRFPE